MNIYQKLVEVRKSIKSFKKDATGYNFKYVPGVQVLTEIKSIMDSEGIVLETHLIDSEVVRLEKINKSGAKEITWFVTSKMKMIWVNSEKTDDRIVIDWFCTGEQKDPSQALGSALTYSERYFLLKFFSIPTDEDDPDSKKQTENNSMGKTVDLDAQLKKDLVKKHKGDKIKAKAEYMTIKAKEKAKPKEEAKEDAELESDIEEYLEEKFEMDGAK